MSDSKKAPKAPKAQPKFKLEIDIDVYAETESELRALETHFRIATAVVAASGRPVNFGCEQFVRDDTARPAPQPSSGKGASSLN